MLTGNGNEIGKKINTSNWSKKQLCMTVQHTFLYISLTLFCTATS